ncbi:MAG TPA: class I SAM-dependent methyltransferase [Nitrososphaerales archaeon]|nr:class I SAM-dependent methyltransferase [Nitrososphaerales archaeon]
MVTPSTGSKDKLHRFLVEEYNHPFKGWDFSYITAAGRMSEGPRKWSYGSIVLSRIRQSSALLDIATGGGELLATFSPLPPVTCATESYKPNIPVARKLLEPLGVEVFETEENGPLPFEDEKFDLVIDRHESYSPTEVFRVLKPRGWFITQQVGDKNDGDLRKLLGTTKFKPNRWNLKLATSQLKKSGFTVVSQKQGYHKVRYFDIGALVYHFKAVPWIIPDFSVKKYFPVLRKLNNIIEREGYLEVRNHRFLVVAMKPPQR